MAPLRFCAHPGCPTRVVHGRCPEHKQVVHKKRTRQERGYGKEWQRFRRVEFPGMLSKEGIVQTCGARLSPGWSKHSRCAAAGVINIADGLELDHDPPLRDDERGDVDLVCDPTRVSFLCKSCHAAKTRGEHRQ